jgi:AraC family transcriptional activator of pobA
MMQIHFVRHDAGINWREDIDVSPQSIDLILVTYGKCLYRIDQKKVILEKGDILLIPKFTPFYGTSIPTVTHEKYVIRFSNFDSLSQLPLLSSNEYIKWKPGRFDLLLDLIKSMLSQWEEQEEHFEVMCLAKLLEILVNLSREINSGPHSAEKHQAVESMKNYIKNHYREKVTKEILSVVIERSPNYSATLFSKVTGQTIGQYLHRIRIQTAIFLLHHSALSITEISENLGYSDPSYFHKIFKSITGKTPSDFLQSREIPLK